MKYCPKCRSEYREGFQTCSDCGLPLTDRLSDVPDPLIGQSLAALLEDNGIRCILKSEQIPVYANVAMMLRSRWGQLMVLEGDRARAEDLIKEYLSAPAQEESEGEK
jgi:hypothetical protein